MDSRCTKLHKTDVPPRAALKLGYAALLTETYTVVRETRFRDHDYLACS